VVARDLRLVSDTLVWLASIPQARPVSDTLVWVAGLTQAITGVVAVAALGVSIYGLYLQRRDKSPRLQVRGSLSSLMDHNMNVMEYVFMITVANKSTAPVTVTQIYIWDRPNWKLVVQDWRGDRTLPCELEPWQSASWWSNYEGLRETLRSNGHRGKVRVKLEATDASGGSHAARTKIILNAPWWRRIFGRE
jgi:hypothetical protein